MLLLLLIYVALRALWKIDVYVISTNVYIIIIIVRLDVPRLKTGVDVSASRPFFILCDIPFVHNV